MYDKKCKVLVGTEAVKEYFDTMTILTKTLSIFRVINTCFYIIDAKINKKYADLIFKSPLINNITFIRCTFGSKRRVNYSIYARGRVKFIDCDFKDTGLMVNCLRQYTNPPTYLSNHAFVSFINCKSLFKVTVYDYVGGVYVEGGSFADFQVRFPFNSTTVNFTMINTKVEYLFVCDHGIRYVNEKKGGLVDPSFYIDSSSIGIFEIASSGSKIFELNNDSTLWKSIMSKKIKRVKFSGISFHNCDFRESSFRDIEFVEPFSTFEECNMENADISGVQFFATSYSLHKNNNIYTFFNNCSGVDKIKVSENMEVMEPLDPEDHDGELIERLKVKVYFG